MTVRGRVRLGKVPLSWDTSLGGTGKPVSDNINHHHVLRGTIQSHLRATGYVPEAAGLSHLCPHSTQHSQAQRKHPANESPNAFRIIKL